MKKVTEERMEDHRKTKADSTRLIVEIIKYEIVIK